MDDLYIYYQVADGRAAALFPAVTAMQASLAARHGVRPQLKRRPGSKDGLQTWMEVYPSVPAGFPDALDAAAAAAGLSALVTGPRHNEVFVDLTPETGPCA